MKGEEVVQWKEEKNESKREAKKRAKSD